MCSGTQCFSPFVMIAMILLTLLSPSIIIQILLTDLHSFNQLLIGRICLNIKTIHVCQILLSCICVIIQVDTTRRNLMLMTIGVSRVKELSVGQWENGGQTRLKLTVRLTVFFFNFCQALGMLFWHKHNLEKSLTDLANFTPFPGKCLLSSLNFYVHGVT